MPTKNEIKDYLRDVIQKHDTRLATPTKAGLMSAADKIKLDNIQFDFEIFFQGHFDFHGLREGFDLKGVDVSYHNGHVDTRLERNPRLAHKISTEQAPMHLFEYR